VIKKVRAIALVLPQYHPIPENDEWWGKGFTEWTNVAKAKPLFKGHYQPHIPADLGFYDLRVPEARQAQAELARFYGIEGFCYYHYWFGNKRRLLERPFNEILDSSKPDFPFCLCWANQTWKGIWFGNDNPDILIEQLYPGKQDYIDHFNFLLKAFKDERYIMVEGKPLFYVYQPLSIPDLKLFVNTFRACAREAGLPGLYLLASHCPLDWNPLENGFDGVIGSEFSTMRYYSANTFESKSPVVRLFSRIRNRLSGGGLGRTIEKRIKPIVVDYKDATRYLITEKEFDFDYYPIAVPNWDNSARAGMKSLIFKDSAPGLWKIHFKQAMNKVINYPEDKRIVFIKSWNEWAEGNHLEPDLKWGLDYLKATKEALEEV
jgi:hypothetical protein